MNIDPEDILGRGNVLRPYPVEKMTPGSFETDLQEIFPPMIANIPESVKAFRKNEPILYKKFFPKTYQDVDQYCNWRAPHLMAAMHVFGANRVPEYYKAVQAAVNTVHHVIRWYANDMPLFFVARDFYNDVRQTEVPADWDFNEMKWPFDSYTFVLPRGVLYYKNVEVPYIGISICRDGVKTEVGIIESGKGMNEMILSTSFGSAFFGPSFNLDHLGKFYSMSDDTFQEISKQQTSDFEINNAAFTLLLFKIAIKLTIAMEAAPEHVERGRLVGMTTKNGVKSEIWKPNVIGKRYRVSYTGGASEGTHVSPRMHWRRGHFRQQRFGPNNSEVKSKWIKRMFIKGPKEEE